MALTGAAPTSNSGCALRGILVMAATEAGLEDREYWKLLSSPSPLDLG